MRTALSVAGSDSCGGAGIQADLKAFSAHGVYGMSVITAVTAQNTLGVLAVQDITPEVIEQQLDAIFVDIPVDALKIGMVSRIETIQSIAMRLIKHGATNIVIDPVMISKSGYALLQPTAMEALVKVLLPLAHIVTPNIPEAELITGMSITSIADMERAAVMISQYGPRHVLVKGGHLDTDAVDVLFDGTCFRHFSSPRIYTTNTHGTGCTLSAAIAANLANRLPIIEAVQRAKQYITTAIEHSFRIGKGVGPVHHFYDLYQKAGLKV
ncbi:MAG: bifunctional hydroxymethylpyrimidine kinase/phosphomethylpyrimidine kinase [Bacillota bacterium]|nr:bifunctional hydroxymethylpyrimidine kinase/phosphomethylpyrimidine kinase [Bacillota bacterium]